MDVNFTICVDKSESAAECEKREERSADGLKRVFF